jgi:hypothetical protein
MIARLVQIVCVLAALAACAQSNTSADLSAATSQPADVQPSPPPATAPPPKVALTPEEAKTQCWMKYESDKRAKNIDARLALVEKCVDETMRGQLVQAPQR